jgi:hypothetical protein
VPVSEDSCLGDLVFCLDYIKKTNPKIVDKELSEHLFLLEVHGLLHLLGYDHKNKKEENEMFSLQNELLLEGNNAFRTMKSEFKFNFNGNPELMNAKTEHNKHGIFEHNVGNNV